MSKHGFSLICICPYVEIICDSVHMDMILIQTEKIKIFLLKVKKRSSLRLILPSLKLSRIFEAVLRRVTTSGVPLIVVATT